MEFVVYILYSPALDQFYVGHTSDIDDRLFMHNNSGSKSTKKANDWKLIYKEMFQSKTETSKEKQRLKIRRAVNILNG